MGWGWEDRGPDEERWLQMLRERLINGEDTTEGGEKAVEQRGDDQMMGVRWWQGQLEGEAAGKGGGGCQCKKEATYGAME